MTYTGVDKRTRAEQRAAKARRMASDGVPQLQIAQQLGVSRWSVSEYLADPDRVKAPRRSDDVANPLPNTDTPCSTHPTPDLWFSEESHPVIVEAKAICEDCPVREACLQYALEARIPYGIWGGLTTAERQRMRRRAA